MELVINQGNTLFSPIKYLYFHTFYSIHMKQAPIRIQILSETIVTELLTVWEASVRSTHHFLTEADIQFYKKLIPHYFSAVELYVIRNGQGETIAFMGLSDELIEMLFIHPREQGKGLGKQLMLFAIKERTILKVDVNEQNTHALHFYQHIGFEVTSRDEVDSSGKPYPILHMKIH